MLSIAKHRKTWDWLRIDSEMLENKRKEPRIPFKWLEMTGNWALKRKKEKAEKKERNVVVVLKSTKNITRIRMYIVVGFKF